MGSSLQHPTASSQPPLSATLQDELTKTPELQNLLVTVSCQGTSCQEQLCCFAHLRSPNLPKTFQDACEQPLTH